MQQTGYMSPILARIPCGLVLKPPNFPDSPCAMVDEFTGSPDDADTPEWVTREKTWVMFRQRRGRFALLFVSMAVWQYNRWKVILVLLSMH